MASVNYMKAKAPQDVKRVIRHCDKEMRQNDNHENKHIDKSVTARNLQYGGSYSEVCNAYDKRIEYLDSLDGANKRKDRVSFFFLEVPLPEALMSPEYTDKDRVIWCGKVTSIVKSQYGAENVICGYIHMDEKHRYKNCETGKECESRYHMHIGCIPEHDGKLNGKWFSSKANMINLNNAIHEMTQTEFGVQFMDGSKKKSGKSMNQMKLESEIISLQQQHDELQEENRKLINHSSSVKETTKQYEAQQKALQDEIARLQVEREELLAENAKMAQIASERVRKANELFKDACVFERDMDSVRDEYIMLRQQLYEKQESMKTEAKRQEMKMRKTEMEQRLKDLEALTSDIQYGGHDSYMGIDK